MVATLAQAASAAYYLESQRSFRHPLPIRLTHTPTRDRFCVYNG